MSSTKAHIRLLNPEAPNSRHERRFGSADRWSTKARGKHRGTRKSDVRVTIAPARHIPNGSGDLMWPSLGKRAADGIAPVMRMTAGVETANATNQ